MAKNIELLRQEVAAMRNEVEDFANSAERVGGVVSDVLEYSHEESERAKEAEELIGKQAEQNFKNFSELGVEESAKMDGFEIALTKKTNTAEKTRVKIPVYDTQNHAAHPVGLVDEVFVEDMGAMMDGKIGDALKGFKPEGGGGSVEVVQSTGDSTSAVMSQKAVTEELEYITNLAETSYSTVGTDSFPEFSTAKNYKKGDVVQSDGKLYQFTDDYVSGESYFDEVVERYLIAPATKDLEKKIEQAVSIIPRTDDVDITSENGKLRLANRLYDESNPTGKGYVILRKEKTLAEQITSPNTIYEIRDSFDMGGKTVKIDNSTFYYNGGNLYNGRIEGENIRVIGFNDNEKIFTNGFNYKEYETVCASNIGMIANDENSSSWNTNILRKIIDKNCNLIIDANYYYTSESIELRRNINISGKSKDCVMFVQGGDTSNAIFFKVLEGCMNISFSNITIKRYNGEKKVHMMYQSSLSFEVDRISYNNCIIDGVSAVYISGNNIDYDAVPFGVNEFEFVDNVVNDDSNVYGFCTMENMFFRRSCKISNNIFNNVSSRVFWFAITNYYDYLPGAVKKYSSPVYVENNIVNGTVTDQGSLYNSFLVIENTNKLYFRNNIIKNVISIYSDGDNVSYDCYALVPYYYCENNHFENIATIPKNGAVKNTMDEFGKSKSEGKIRFFKGNTWINDYNRIKDIIKEKYESFELDDSTYSNLSVVGLFLYDNPQDELIFKDNNVTVVAGKVSGKYQHHEYTTNYVKKGYISGNTFDCRIVDNLFLVPSDSEIVWNNNEFINPDKDVALLTLPKASIDQDSTTVNITVTNNVFRNYVISQMTTMEHRGAISKNRFILSNESYEGTIYASNGIDDCELAAVPLVNNSIYIFGNKIKLLLQNVRTYGEINNIHYISDSLAKSPYLRVTIKNDKSEKVTRYVIHSDYNGNSRTVYDETGGVISVPNSIQNYVGTDGQFAFYVPKIANDYVFGILATSASETRNVEVFIEPFKAYSFRAKGGSSNIRPSLSAADIGFNYYDIDLNKAIWWDGSKWVDANGTSV